MRFSTLPRAKDPTIVSPFETVGASCIGKTTREEFESIEQLSCTGLGVCGARYAANAEGVDHRSVRRQLFSTSPTRFGLSVHTKAGVHIRVAFTQIGIRKLARRSPLQDIDAAEAFRRRKGAEGWVTAKSASQAGASRGTWRRP
ncbi:hypothetical protein TM102_49520 [Bradyrhizobium sp. TM102]|nr:hypothetical protein TM102_49520 [Bradyrhizobium sp. TM102]